MDVQFSGELAILNNIVEIRTITIPKEGVMTDLGFEWYTSTSNSLAQHNHYMSQAEGSPGVFFSAFQAQMKLQKDSSEIQTQVLVGLHGQSLPMDVVNDQVFVKSAEIPSFTEIMDQNSGLPMAEAPGYFTPSPHGLL